MIDLDAALRSAATPELYRANAFRLAGHDVDTPPAGVTAVGRGLFPLVPKPGDGEVRAALRRLRVPSARVVDEFFWFWPADVSAGTDVARLDAAWEADGTDAAHHNLAVLNHLLALDADHDVRVAAARWRRAYTYWRKVWRSDAFWDLFAARVARFQDARVDPAAVAATFRAELPSLLARIGAAVALRWADRRQPEAMVDAHWQLVEYDGFPDDVRATAKAAAIDVVAAHVRATIAAWRPPAEPGLTSSDAAQTLRLATQPALRILGRAAAWDVSAALHDEVADQLVTMVVDGRRGGWFFLNAAMGVLHWAKELARGADVIYRINAETARLEREWNRFPS